MDRDRSPIRCDLWTPGTSIIWFAKTLNFFARSIQPHKLSAVRGGDGSVISDGAVIGDGECGVAQRILHERERRDRRMVAPRREDSVHPSSYFPFTTTSTVPSQPVA